MYEQLYGLDVAKKIHWVSTLIPCETTWLGFIGFDKLKKPTQVFIKLMSSGHDLPPMEAHRDGQWGRQDGRQ